MPQPDTTEGDINTTNARKHHRQHVVGPNARALLDRDDAVFLHQSLSTPCLNALATAHDATLTDLDGNHLLDFHGNSVHQLGHGNPHVIDAITRALHDLPFSPRRYTNRYAVEFAEALTARAPGNMRRVLFAPGGTSAVGIALKLARLATNRSKTLSFYDAFHGASLDAIAVGGEALFRHGMGPLTAGALHVPPPATYRDPVTSGPADPMRALADLRYVVNHEPDIACIVAEPLRCTTVEIPPPDFWRGVRQLCDEHGILLVFDEIPLCMGRVGPLFASSLFDAHPDMIILGKALGGGIMPLAALLTREELNVGANVALGHYTHEKSPVACAAGLATLDVLENHGVLDGIAPRSSLMHDLLTQLHHDFDAIGDVRGVGLLFALELVKSRDTREPDPALAERILYRSLRDGLSFKLSSGNVITLSPPLTITPDELTRAAAILRNALAAG